MISPKHVPLVLKHVYRHHARSLLTILGVAVAMFLFCSVKAMQKGVRSATEVSAGDTTLIVYRENRYCPFSSRLPQYYQQRIESIPGVESAVPVRILVSNCRASLDVVTFRGVGAQEFLSHYVPKFQILRGSARDWERRSDAALVGESLAARRGIDVGQQLTAAGITVYVAGIFRSDEPQDQNVAYTHLAFVQESAQRGGTGGIVTQFNVKVDDPQRLDEIATAIDREFANDQDPTFTSPEKAFVARAATDVLQIVEFASWLGWGAVLAVFGLVANAIVLAVQDRIRDHAILQTLGYSSGLIARLVITEGTVLGALGGGVGALAAYLVISQGRFSLTMEGLNVEVASDASMLIAGFAVSILLGVGASLIPAWQASRREIAACFRAV